MSIWHTLRASLQRDGLAPTLVRGFRGIGRVGRRAAPAAADPAAVFTRIYERNEWHSGESVSGHGSTLAYTENLRRELPALLARHRVESVFDAPCGDFNWMRLVAAETRIRYHGADIVAPLIAANRRQYGSAVADFSVLDITRDAFPAADLWLCRDCLFHLSYADTLAALENFARSRIPRLLTSSHLNPQGLPNRDIRTGGYREIDLYSAPFGLPGGPRERIADWIPPFPPRDVVLWTREEVAAALPAFRAHLAEK